jgi:hypothetical protein
MDSLRLLSRKMTTTRTKDQYLHSGMNLDVSKMWWDTPLMTKPLVNDKSSISFVRILL